jgi:hypothetical protein
MRPSMAENFTNSRLRREFSFARFKA